MAKTSFHTEMYMLRTGELRDTKPNITLHGGFGFMIRWKNVCRRMH